MPYHNPTSSLHFPGNTQRGKIRQDPSAANEGSAFLYPPSETSPFAIYGTRETSPFDHLPVEILIEIFLLCPLAEGLPRRFQFDRPAEPRRRQAPLLLCQVSRYWREVALSLPRLWCSLTATGRFITPHPPLVELWLARSRGLPLSLHLEAPSNLHDEPKYHSHVSKIFDLFSKEIHRWRTISFIFDNKLARQFMATVDSRAQKLEELELVFREPNRHITEVASLLPSFPNLRKLSWSGSMPATSLRNIPFHQLTHLYIASRASAEDVLSCLSQCMTAVEVRWYWVCTDSLSVCKLPQTTLPHLQSLFLEGRGDLAIILSRMTLPSLVYLRLQTYSPGTRDHRILEDFFARSSCPLERFILHDENLDQESVISYLAIPFLESISDIEIHFQHSKDMLARMQGVKDSQNTPTFHRLKIAYPDGMYWPAFTWK